MSQAHKLKQIIKNLT